MVLPVEGEGPDVFFLTSRGDTYRSGQELVQLAWTAHLLTAAGDPMTEISDRQFNINFFNSAAAAKYGLPPSRCA